MTRIECPACGFVHECRDEAKEVEEAEKEKTLARETKGYTLSYTRCHCGCGCGHKCNILYGPYLKVQNKSREKEIREKVGSQVIKAREANHKIHKGHMKAVHAALHKNGN